MTTDSTPTPDAERARLFFAESAARSNVREVDDWIQLVAGASADERALVSHATATLAADPFKIDGDLAKVESRELLATVHQLCATAVVAAAIADEALDHDIDEAGGARIDEQRRELRIVAHLLCRAHAYATRSMFGEQPSAEVVWVQGESPTEPA